MASWVSGALGLGALPSVYPASTIKLVSRNFQISTGGVGVHAWVSPLVLESGSGERGSGSSTWRWFFGFVFPKNSSKQ